MGGLYWILGAMFTQFREGEGWWHHFENQASEIGMLGGIVEGSVCSNLQKECETGLTTESQRPQRNQNQLRIRTKSSFIELIRATPHLSSLFSFALSVFSVTLWLVRLRFGLFRLVVLNGRLRLISCWVSEQTC